MSKNSIKSRFFVSLIGNILRSGINFTTSLLVARLLGPNEFGRMAFLIAIFTSIKSLVDLGTSSAFFTFISQKIRSKRFIIFYWKWISLQFLFIIFILFCILPTSLIEKVFFEKNKILILLAFIATFMQGTFWQISSQMAEAQRNTLKVQIINVVTIIFHLIVVLTLWKFKIIGIVFLFISIIIEWLIAGVLASKLYNNSSNLITENNFIVESKHSIYKEYKAYCLPLIPYVIFGFIYEFGDRWMKNKYVKGVFLEGCVNYSDINKNI